MESELNPKARHNIESVTERRYDELGAFADKVIKKHPGMIASAVATRPGESDPDIRLTLVVDDLNNVVTDQQVKDLKLSADELAYSTSLPVICDSITASDVWNGFRSREARVRDLVRDGLVIHDVGFLQPIQDLLVTGKVRPSKESMKVYFVKAERSVKTADEKIKRAVIDLYWSVTDAAHAAVMLAGMTPPSPAHMGDVLRKELVARNLVHRRCGDVYDRIFTAAKKIMHREVFTVSGREFDSYHNDADFFIKEMASFVKQHAGAADVLQRS